MVAWKIIVIPYKKTLISLIYEMLPKDKQPTRKVNIGYGQDIHREEI